MCQSCAGDGSADHEDPVLGGAVGLDQLLDPVVEGRPFRQPARYADEDRVHFDEAMAKAENIGYQTLINQTLRRGLGDPPLDEETLRSVIREELGRYAISEQPDTD